MIMPTSPDDVAVTVWKTVTDENVIVPVSTVRVAAAFDIVVVVPVNESEPAEADPE